MNPVKDTQSWEGIKQSSKKDGWKKIKKNNTSIPLTMSYAKEKIYILLTFQNINQSVD